MDSPAILSELGRTRESSVLTSVPKLATTDASLLSRFAVSSPRTLSKKMQPVDPYTGSKIYFQ
jgi:hypothetical protein